MNQKFRKKELERLGCTEEEIKLVMEYQRKLPIIVDNMQINKFCVDARTLHAQLESKKKFSEWIKGRIKTYNFVETLDFTKVAPNQETCKFGGDTRSENYSLTLDMAKQLAMVEKTESGKNTRTYFILLEELIHRNKDWWDVRNPQRENYLPMCNSISESIHRICGRYGDDYDFKREADILNIIAVGSRAQSIKNYLGVGTNAITRDNLLTDYNEKISFLQEQNILVLGMDMPIIQRVKMLIGFFDTKYPNAKPIKDYHNREYMVKAREHLINELSN